MVSITDRLLQDAIDKDAQGDMLHRELFDVNIRLYNKSVTYKTIIRDIVNYMLSLCELEFTDYPKVKGISGANVGIPFNIVVINKIVLLNPRIVEYSTDTKVVKSNCGSLRLENKTDVERAKQVVVEYTTMDGVTKTEEFDGALGSTMQHEIDHNNGITILDRSGRLGK